MKMEEASPLRQIIRASGIGGIRAGPRSKELGIDDAYRVVLREESVLIGGSDLQVMGAFHIRQVRVSTGIGQRSILARARALKESAEIVERIGTGVVIVSVSAHKTANGQYCRCPK